MEEIKIKGMNETIYYDECNNGLKVYMWVNKRLHSFYGTLSIKYGSIYNNFKIGNKLYKLPNGVAHFLEHVKFNEKKDVSANMFFNKNGCDTNAFTTFDYTNYQVFGNELVKDNVIHLLDFVQNDYFTKSIIKNEKGIIVEEARMGEDDPYTVMLFDHLKNIFHNYEYKNEISGKVEDIKKITIDDIKLAFNSFYHPQNMFLVVTGNFNPYELMEAIKDNQNSKEFSKYIEPERIIKKEPIKVKVKYEEKSINVSTKKIKIGIKIPKDIFNKYDDLHIRIYLSLLLKANFGITSDFRDELLEKELINGMSYYYDLFDDYIVIMFTIDSEYKEEIIKLFNERFNSISIDEKTFNRMKNASIATYILKYEDVEIVNDLIQKDLLRYNKLIVDKKEIYENLIYEDLIKFTKLLDFKEQSILILNPLKK